ncbi:hypothetical protein ACPOLB_23085 [Rubrivivax sp. RP6-9]
MNPVPTRIRWPGRVCLGHAEQGTRSATPVDLARFPRSLAATAAAD